MVFINFDKSSPIALNSDSTVALKKLFKRRLAEGSIVLLTSDGYWVIASGGIILTVKE